MGIPKLGSIGSSLIIEITASYSRYTIRFLLLVNLVKIIGPLSIQSLRLMDIYCTSKSNTNSCFYSYGVGMFDLMLVWIDTKEYDSPDFCIDIMALLGIIKFIITIIGQREPSIGEHLAI